MSWRRLLIVVALLLAGVAYATDPPALSDGIAAVGAGDYTRATLLLQPLLADRPHDSVLNYWLGRAYYAQRQFSAAAKCLGVAANYDGDNHDVCLWNARALRAAGKGKEAAEAYEVLLTRFPSEVSVLAEYGAAQALAGDYAGARATFAQLLAQHPSPASREAIAAWIKTLDGLSSLSQLEPASHMPTAQFELCYDADDGAVQQVRDLLEETITRTASLTGIQVKGFRVLLFPSWDAYARYAMILLPGGAELHAAAFTLPGVMVLWSPDDWPRSSTATHELTAIVRHEMIHLALYQHTGGENFPLWLNEGIACYFGGWGGMQSGKIPATPLSFDELDNAFLQGELATQEQAYAQAHAMVTVLAHHLGTAHLLEFVDRLVAGDPIASAYASCSGEQFATFLTTWPQQFADRQHWAGRK